MNCGSFESDLQSKYGEIRRRLAYPRKPVITLPIVGPKIGSPIRLQFGEDISPHSRRHIYSRQRLRELFEKGMTFIAIAEELGITAAAARKVVRKQGWTRE